MSELIATTNQDNVLDQDELNQILIKIRQHCFTHRGVDPEQLFNRWDRDKDGTLDYDEMRLLMYKVLSTSEQEFEQLLVPAACTHTLAMPASPSSAALKKSDVLSRINSVLDASGLNDCVWSVRDCDSTLFVLIFKKLVGKVREEFDCVL